MNYLECLTKSLEILRAKNLPPGKQGSGIDVYFQDYGSKGKHIIEIVEKHSREKIIIGSGWLMVSGLYLQINNQPLLLYQIMLQDQAPTRKLFLFRGGLSSKQREKLLQDWKSSDAGILLVTKAVGAVGLNLQKGRLSPYLYQDLTNKSFSLHHSGT